ncbi:MAG: CRISPR-associated helicase Cas3' [Nitrospira sp.]|nr:CRISPR-associated helicase Cas3' [Nitrospira sp.]MDH5194074.1 CRISPR-associated helicase Cas3' [Nitrospira sp.]
MITTQYLAKREPRQTYGEHLEAVYSAWCQIAEQHAGVIQRVCDNTGVKVDRLLMSSLLTVVFHDIGKMTVAFQEMMLAGDGELTRARRKNFRHEYASFPFVAAAAVLLQRVAGPLLPDTPRACWEGLVVLGHHKPLESELTSFEREMAFAEPLVWVEKGPDCALEVARSLFSRRGWELPVIPIERCKEKAAGKDVRQILMQSLPNNGAESRALFAVMKSLLMVPDWWASSSPNPAAVVVKSRAVVPAMLMRASIKAEIEVAGKSFEGLRPFQEQCSASSDHVIAIAPTGSGKTEASVLWACKQIDTGKVTKLLYLLPTMVTANAIHRRLSRLFSKHQIDVGLSHSLADLSREDGEEGEGDTGEYRQSVLFEKHCFPPITVATVDQLLSALMHGGRWPLKTWAAMDAAIVLDEIHAYDPYTLALITQMVGESAKAGSRFFMMSATLPTVVVKALKEALGETAPVGEIRDSQLLVSARNCFTVYDKLIENDIEEIIKQVRAGRRVLVVVNTVGKCQELAEILRGAKPICYHSKFILRDRTDKEEDIQGLGPRLVVATQVVEVSLDIDYDVLFTECAPPDAVAQRAGRVNRRRRPIPGEVRIYRPSKGSERIYFDDVVSERIGTCTLLDRSWQAFIDRQGLVTERDLTEMVEGVYRGLDPKEHPAFNAACSAVRDVQARLGGVLDRALDEQRLLTRLESYYQVSVIPFEFREEVLSLRPRERRRYEVKMPWWYVKRCREDIEGITFCRMKYDTRLGARFEKEESLAVF